MIRIISYIVFSVFTITLSLAQVKSEEITINNQAIQLPGTLSYSTENQPLIIWIHGSGNVDRNGNQAGANVNANYIKQFRDAVNKQGIAFFSYDKRTANSKNMTFIQKEGVLFSDFILDAKEVINHFKKDKRFSKIILAGHSQGSLVAMNALEKVDKYISIAGAGETVDKTIIKQVTAQSADLGKTAAAHFKELAETGSIKEVNPMLMSIFAPQNQPFFNTWMKENPTEILKQVTIPILILNGDKDLQVKISDAEALHNANSKSKMVIIENMNHVLKNIEKEESNMKSYFSPDFPISEQLIETIVSFVKK
mgnify:FL=1